MALIDEVKAMCDRLAPHGWAELFKEHELDITAADLKAELARSLPMIKRGVKGFEDFALEGKRGIEPGHPARSLLYHGFASPEVQRRLDGTELKKYPTLAELDILENYVFGVEPPSLDDLRARAGDAPLAICVFALEYRPASQTCHRKHADLVFSRTGVARVGTSRPLYDAKRRGFLPFVDGEPFAIRVSPVRYSAYLAVQKPGDAASFCPMRFDAGFADDEISDQDRMFWLPIHKLFSGTECLRDFPQGLQVNLSAQHFNEKIKRIHIELAKQGFDTGAHASDLDKDPFSFKRGIAEWSTDSRFGPWLLVPVVHSRLVEPAAFKGKPLTFNVPADHDTFSSSFMISGKENSSRHAPEFVHVRHRINPKGKQVDLNDERDVEEIVQAGGYKALHYVDYTGDGWINASCPPLTDPGSDLSGPLPAYSLVTAPDFFPTCDQRELMEWSEDLPPALLEDIWSTPPIVLSDQRLAANLQLPDSPFDKDDKTLTTIVSLFGEISQHATNAKPTESLRHSPLPDDSAGVFAPGWDVSRDELPDGTMHFAAYGLGSPFPEDAKLCAALSTFWPAAAPDANRTFVDPELIPITTVSPLTDEEIGQIGEIPWDGIPGPKIVTSGSTKFVEYSSLAHADYVQSALDNKFSLALTSHIGPEEYERRVLAMALAYKAVRKKKSDWLLISFQRVTPGDTEFQQAQQQAKATLPGRPYRFEMCSTGELQEAPNNFRRRRIKVTNRRTLFVDPDNRIVLLKVLNEKWARV
ncbi:MAG: hypothetical protein QOJ64_476 [Acidobacteriota bacterium]|nr:hypothetical protein [Acidobacteriota bacterium]